MYQTAWQTFKIKMLIYPSKANLHVKILLGRITHHLDPEIREMSLKGHIWESIGSKSLNLRKKAGVKFNDPFL